MIYGDNLRNIRSHLTTVERPARYFGGEINSVKPGFNVDFHFCLAFPDLYDLGIAYHGFQILYHLLNGIEGVQCERCYLPWIDMQDLMRRRGVSLYSLETGRSMDDFDAIGITLQNEMHYPGVVKLLDLARIPRRSSDRSDSDPLIIGGGPCAFHPEPISLFFDAFVVGDGEEALPEMVEVMRDRGFHRASRAEKWLALSHIDGVYVPALYDSDPLNPRKIIPTGGQSRRIGARTITSLKPEYYSTKPIVPFIQGAHDRLTVEIMRGCSQGCRFCQAGMIQRPVRERPVDDIVTQVVEGLNSTGWNEVGLLSLSTSDYSQLEELLGILSDRLSGRRATLAFPSLRPTSFTESIAGINTGGRRSTLTFAVEAGSQRLRDVINKGLTEPDLESAVDRAYRHGWRVVKLYFMVGLPSETDEDIDEGAAILNHLQKTVPKGRELHVSVSPFIPKPHTVFQTADFENTSVLLARQKRLFRSVSRKWVKTNWRDPSLSLVESILSRGDRRLAPAIEMVSDSGTGFESWGGQFYLDRWTQALDRHLPGWKDLIHGIQGDEHQPWDHLSKGFTKQFLDKDLTASKDAVVLPDCRSGECYLCGIMTLCRDAGNLQTDTFSDASKQNDSRVTAPSTRDSNGHPGETLSPMKPALSLNSLPGGNGGAAISSTAGKSYLKGRQAALPATSAEPTAVNPKKYRYRLTFSKLNRVRLLGHRDLMRAVERALNRAGIPLLYRLGYASRPRISFGPAIPLGHGANKLWLEFESSIDSDLSDWSVHLKAALPRGIKPWSIERVQKMNGREVLPRDLRELKFRFNKPFTDKAVSSGSIPLSDGCSISRLSSDHRTVYVDMIQDEPKPKPDVILKGIIGQNEELDGAELLSVTHLY